MNNRLAGKVALITGAASGIGAATAECFWHAGANVLIVSYHITGLPIDDVNYDPFPESIFIHDNQFIGGGTAPDSEPLALLQAATQQPIPDIVWDGTVAPDKQAADILCLRNNGEQTFANLDASNAFAAPSFDSSPHDCALPNLSVISLSSAQ